MSAAISDPCLNCSTLVELLRTRVLEEPGHRAYTYLLDGETKEVTLSYAELDEQARAIGAQLLSMGASGERVLLLYPSGLEFITAFFGCLYAGAVAVPAYPPRLNRQLSRLQVITGDAQAVIALTTDAILARLKPLMKDAAGLQALRWIATDSLPVEFASGWSEPEIRSDTLAFLQYTSGSTAAPKGVMVGHGNLLHNQQLIRQAFKQTDSSIVVGWLPLYHDMGLIGNVLQPLYLGATCILMSPTSFLQRPFRWLQAISRFRATTSGAPNFAYDLCARKVTPEQRSTLDLNSWSVAYNGAENVRADTMEIFARVFEACGFRREAFYPCYGLAEATLLVTGNSRGGLAVVKSFQAQALERNLAIEEPADTPGVSSLVSCGQALLGQQLVIADPETTVHCAEGEIGEIRVAGPSIAQGYWNNPEATAQTFRGFLAEPGAGPFLRTGDLGFVKDGELYVTGRLKDLIIIRGRNLYPQDIEATAERSHPAVRPGGGAAFPVNLGGEERLVVVQEVEPRQAALPETVIDAIRQAITEEHEVQVHAVTLIKPRSLPKTSSGKIQRHACRDRFLADSLESLAEWRASIISEVEARPAPVSALPPHIQDISEAQIKAWLVTEIAARIGGPESSIDATRSLARYGLDSLVAVELAHTVENKLGIVLPMTMFLQSYSIAALAREIVTRLKEPAADQGSASALRASGNEAGALSRGQQALWFMQMIAPESAAYNISNAVRIKTELDRIALRRVFQLLVDRHPALRTTFAAPQGEPVQRVHEHLEVSFAEHDTSTWSDDQLQERLTHEAHRPFDLEHGPLLRVHLFTCLAHNHVLLVVIHHIVSDFWSLGILMHEMSTLYAARASNPDTVLAPLELQYTDYAHWQVEMLASPEGEGHWNYWRDQLATKTPVLNLPLDKPRLAVQSFRGAAVPYYLPPELTQRFKDAGQAKSATLYMALLAAFHVLLHRYTGQTEIFIGSPTSGRDRADLANVVGYFVNPVVLRADLSGNPTFSALLEQVRQTVLESFEHQAYPFPLLVERLQPGRDTSYSPLFQVMFVLQKAQHPNEEGLAAFALGDAEARIRLGELELESVALEQRIAQFDLTLIATELNGGLGLSVQYSTDLFEGATIRRLLGHFERLLESIIDLPQAPITELPLLTAAENHQLLVAHNDTSRAYPSASLMHTMVEAQAARTPEAVAVTFDEQQLTYRELNDRADQLAQHLRALGVGPEVSVAILVERSAAMVVGLLGILKAGGAYVPLDPAYPHERLAFMLEDSRAEVLLTQHSLLHVLPANSAEVVCLDAVPEAALTSQLPPEVMPENAAYIIYTSGSTGRPKGVVITHGSAATLFNWSHECFDAESLSGVLAATSICFDLSVFEIFVPLTVGGTVIVAQNALQLPTLKAAAMVTLINTVPSAMTELVRLRGVGPRVRTVILAGEPLTRRLVEQVYQTEQVQEVWNLYGPSEDTTYSTWSLVAQGEQREPAIGRPVANTQCYILDAHGQIVPLGVVGELYIGGEGLARGYLNRPALTAERFVPNAFGRDPDARLYRTGDLVRYGAGGELEYLGRIDHQVKIRGFRIELGEIEAVLRQHAAVRDVIVVAREDVAGEKRLASYVVSNETALTVGQLREYLKERLPEYMVPAAFVLMDQLPLTPNGKVDRKALPAPDQPRTREITSVAAQTPTEEIITGIWADALRVEQIGTHDNFFELGGHSLLATRVVARVREVFQVNVPLNALFEEPTVAGLAARVGVEIQAGNLLEVQSIEAVAGESVRLIAQRQQLRALVQEQSRIRQAARAASKAPPEEIIADIFGEVLRVERVDTGDNFFEIGGHSLLATRVIARVREVFQVDVPLNALFEEPTVAGLAECVKLEKEAGNLIEFHPIEAVASDGALPLSFAQQRLWFLNQLEPDSSLYNMASNLRLKGRLDAVALTSALNEVIRRHEVLRTVFLFAGEDTVQIVTEHHPLVIPEVDLSHLPPTKQSDELSKLANEHAKQPFDLAHGPLARFTLVRFTEAEHVMLASMHHIVSDGWSVGVFVHEVGILYKSFILNQPSPLPELAIQYADFAWQQREELRGQFLEAQLAYWRNQLAGAPPVLELSLDKPRPARQAYPGASQPIRFSAILSKGLAALSRREGVTLFMTLTAAFQTLLHRYTGQQEIVIGTPIAGRNRHETEALIGCFVNTLVLRTDLSGHPNFRDLLKRVRAVCLGAYAHQDVPFEMLVEELRPERSLNRTPLFQVMLVLQNTPFEDARLTGLEMIVEKAESDTAKFDLLLNLSEQGEELVGWLEYSTEIFEAPTITRMIAHFEMLLQGILSEPELPISAVRLLTAGEERQLLVEWNNTEQEFAGDRYLHQLFEAQVERAPADVAVVFKGLRVTYEELNWRANQLAHYLRTLGVGADVRVGICVERSIEMVVGLLGILKAGGAYVPLDPSYPKERLAFMVRDAGIELMLVQEHLLESLPEHDARLVRLDTDWPVVAAYEVANPVMTTEPDNLAYLIYTSGSTGEPKGVMMSHRGISNHLLWRQSAYPLTTADRFLHKAPISFDISVWEIFGTLIAGARLVMAGPRAQQDAAAIVNLMVSEHVTVAHFGPAMLQAILDEPEVQACHSLCRVFCGGEPLTSDLQARFFELLTAELHQQYGPTETAVDVTVWTCERESARGSIPIGRPIANTVIYVLDEKQQLVPVGVPGELYIGGESVARGYLERPALTAEKFVPHPFTRKAGERLYRTGDVARYLEDGDIEFIGRRDQQVKIRGFRIELGEIETVLRQFPLVKDAVVLARQSGRVGDLQLVAYVTALPDTTLSLDDLRLFIKGCLPEYMIPVAFVALAELPLTTNGKIDRKVLPAPDFTQPRTTYVAPRTPAEEMLAAIWAEVLRLSGVGAHDNFFELGGHSLLATQVMARARRAWQVDVPLSALFESPTVAELAPHFEVALREGVSIAAMPIVPVPREDRPPLSFAQQRIWFLDQLQPGSPLYNIPAAVAVHGPLDISALKQSFSEVVRRHEVLRTTFTDVSGEPVQVIHVAAPVPLPMRNLSELPAADRPAEVERLVSAEAQWSFDLSAGPLLRVGLLRLAEEEHVALINMHHIISDGWSVGVLIQEITSLYAVYTGRQPMELAELTIQYTDYAVWQREHLTGAVLEAQLSYWRTQLAGAPPVLELPTDRARSAVQSHHGATERVELSAELTSGLRELSRRSGTTLFMTLLAGFQSLLSRYTGQNDVVVGTAIAGRTQRETEALIGFFVNILVLRTNVSSEISFNELLQRVREVCLGAYAHQDVPFEMLVEEMQPERSLSHTPLFQVMFALQNAPRGDAEMAGLTIRMLKAESETSKFDLLLNLREGAERLEGWIEYSTELFEGQTIRRMTAHFELLLRGMVAEPGRRVAELAILTEAEKRQLLVEWNDTQSEYPWEQCIHELFEQQAARTPDAMALVFDGQRLSYRELNHQANRLARYLQQVGVGPEVRVGICVERSLEMVVGLLAILKAGGAYVPLDQTYPQERLSFMLEDAQVSVLVTHRGMSERFQESSLRVVCLNTEQNLIAAQSSETPRAEVSADNLAYVIYTSGSTGRPKGVSVTHRAVNRLILNTNYINLNSSDRVAQASNPAFDAATFEIWGTLLNGALLVGISRDVSLSPSDFARQIEDERISVMFLTTALFNQVARNVPQAFRSLRYLLFGGEAVDPRWVREVLSTGAPDHLLHVYGPTENTTFSTWYEVQDVTAEATTVPIGQAIANSQTYVFDQNQQPVPVGVAGELYLGGAGLARDYLNSPELTAQRFIPHSHSDEPGARLYGTGDLVRHRADGNIEFLGRVDHQVKVRGFRVELGEIETVLSAHTSIREALVLAFDDQAGTKRLVAYLVGAEGEPPAVAELRQQLREKLPEHMIPAAIVMLDELPLTPNGKIDRKALRAFDISNAEQEESYVAPRSPVEELLCSIWATVLGAERVSIRDNFFELGGHSLLATQVVSRIRRTFGIDLALRVLFESPAVEELAQSVEALLRGGTQTQAPELRRVSREGTLPLSFAQQRLWFLDQLQPGSSLYNIPAAVRLTGRLDISALQCTISEVVRRHEALRTTFAAVGGEPVQIIHGAAPVPLPIYDLSGLPAAERTAEAVRLVTAEAQRPFDLAADALLRVDVLRLAEGEYIAVLVMHHIIADGWSLGVLIAEVAALYTAYAQGQDSPLAELAIQYADYAVWQREHLTGAVVEAQLSYWRTQLTGAPALLELPTDRVRPAVQSHHGASERVELSAELTSGLRELSQRSGTTLFMTLLAGFQSLLSRYTGESDVVVGTPVAGRTQTEVEELIGFFVNTLVLRTKVEEELSFVQLQERAREVCLGAYAHQDVPFEMLVEELQPERSLSHTPLFQVMVALQNAPRKAIELLDLELRWLEETGEAAKFDLTLNLTENGQELNGSIVYNTDLFDGATIKRMVGHFRRLLEAVVRNPEQRLSQLQFLSGEEQQQLLCGWNDTAREYPHDVCLHHLFELHVARMPDALALVFEDERLTYAELNRRANQLAHHLGELGVTREANVGISMERSVDMIVSMLAALKAGGAFVLLDPSYPQERLAYMMADAGLMVLVTQSRFREVFASTKQRPVVYLDDERSPLAQQPETSPESVVSSEQLAYVIYTSGSTGAPKGIALPHRAVSRMVCNTNYIELTPADCVAQVCNSSFDAAMFEIWGALLNGARLVIIEREVVLSPVALAARIAEHEVTTMLLTTALFNQVAQEAPECLATMQQVMFGGEGADPQATRKALLEGRPERLLNVYGPAESATFTTAYEVKDVGAEATTIPVGRPVANTECYILDGQMRIAPIGVVGELYIGGMGLARGYLNRPSLTAEKFVPHPFSAAPGARLYQSGDVVRYLTDGNIEFIGRRDQQVKLRGFRIELGEIEAALSQHTGVREAVVIAREDVAGQKRLIAYVVSEDEALSPSVHDLRGFIKQRLPEYMIPAAFVLLTELPLTANGKVDRKALPAPEQLDSGSMYVAPRTPGEEIVAGIWARVLRVDRVSVHDNFFELGGHSLLATKVMTQVQEALQQDIPLRVLFEKPTVSELVEHIELELCEKQGARVPQLVPVPRDRRIPLSFAQQRLWFIDQLQPGNALYNIPAAVRLRGPLDIWALERSISEIMRRHEVLRTAFVETEGQPAQLINPVHPFLMPVIDLSSLDESARQAKAQRLAAEEARRPFDLARGPLVRATLLRLSEKEHAALFTLHHIIADAWSMELMIREVVQLYDAFAQGDPSPLPELTIQYADYAVWQRDWLGGEVLEAKLDYWRKQLDGAPPVLELPAQNTRPATQGFRGGTEVIYLPKDLSDELKALSQREGATQFMTLLAAFKTLIYRYTAQGDISIGAPIAGRTRAGIESLIGFFVNTLVLRTRFNQETSFRELLRLVRGVALDAYAHQDVPFEMLVDELHPARSLSYTPLFQAMFTFSPLPPPPVNISLEVAALVSGGGDQVMAKFDLVLAVAETARGLIARFVYNADLFDAEGIADVAARFEMLLGSIVHNPDLALDALSLTPNGKSDLPALSVVRQERATRARTAELAANAPATSRNDKAKRVATQRAELAARRSKLSASQQELLKRRLKPEAVDSPQAEAIPKRSERESAPLSFSQLRLWLLDQLEPGSPLYNMPIALRLKGQLDLVALERTINEIFRRHEILRTVFTISAAEPVQVIKPFTSARLPLIDVSDQDEQAREAELRRLMAVEAHHPFDLAAGPLMRVTLVQLEAADYVALLTMHHIISDGWSMNVLTREIAALYQAFCSGRPSPLTELPIQYADFATWQRERLQGEVLANQLAYWKHHLTGAPPVLELPTDHVRPTVRSMQGALQMFSVPAELTRGLREVAQVGEATLFMTLLAAFEVLLSRYTGQKDVVVGTPVAGRTRAELEPLIGFFVNTLVLWTHVEPGLSFMQLQGRVREVCLGAYEHQDVPFEMLVEELQPERSLSHSPLFQVMFMLQNAPSGGPLSGGEAGRPTPTLELDGMEVHRGTAKFDLLLSLSESGETLQGAFEYSTELFEEQTIRRMVEHLLVLLGAVVTGSQRPLSVLPLLTKGETHQLLTEYNATTTEYPRDLAVHQLFEQQVAYSAHAVALVFQNQQLTYGELNARANQLAHRLVELGVGQETKVGIMVQRSIEMVVGLLGILKAGGAYVPLDASSTCERVAFMLDDAGIEVLLTQQAELDKLVRPPRHILLLDTAEVELADRSTENLPPRATAQNLVYVTYTSGSTGEPKGVEVVQRAVVRLVKQTNYVRLDADEVLLQLAPLAFDASTFEVWGALLNGGRLVVMNGAAATLHEIGAAVEHYGVTTLWLTTGLFHLMVNEELERLRGVRQLLAGGEALSVEHVERAWRKLVQCRLTNGYGPTENTTFTCCYEVVEDGLARRSVPIGRAIANTQVYVLGEEMEAVPVGVAGELYTGGDGLARGYLNRPSLTAEKFMPHPFSTVPGARLYRTGDIVRYLADGNIEFIGRRDQQVKLRGFRIELGEVEAALETHSAVRQTAVVLREESGEKQLVAYVVDGAGEGGVDVAELRQYVRERLPEYMLPASFVLLESLPLKPNGKVDRQQLPALEKSRSEIGATHVAPRDRLELELTRIWEETLRTQPIGVRDNFFELGGHSLTVVRMFAAIERRLNKRFPLMTLFHHPTIEQLAEIIRSQEQSVSWSALVCMQAGGTKPRFFCVHPGGGGVFRYVDLVRRLGPDYPFYALQAAGLEEGQQPETRIEDMAARYIEAMRTVQPDGPYFIGGWSMGGIIALEMSRQLQVLGDEVALLVLMDSALPLAQTRRRFSKKKRRPVAENGVAQFGSFALDLGVSWNRTSPSLEDLLQLTIEGKLALLLEHAIASDKVSQDMKLSDFQRLWEVYRANAMAQFDYVPQTVSCKITLLKAGEHSTSRQSESRLGWDKLSPAGADVYLMPGNHYTMMNEPHVQQLAERLRECIGRAIKEQTASVL